MVTLFSLAFTFLHETEVSQECIQTSGSLQVSATVTLCDEEACSKMIKFKKQLSCTGKHRKNY